MKKLILFSLLVLFLCFTVSAIKIFEVELNPESGNEWVELYNDETQDINISNWELYEGLSTPKNIYTFPENTIINSGDYYIAELNNARTLNNGGDFVTLYDDNLTKIDETPTLKDEDKDSKTWQLCNSEWVFLESTKEQENICALEEPPTNSTNSTNVTTNFSSIQNTETEEIPIEEEPTQTNENTNPSTSSQENKEIQTIKLNSDIQETPDPKPLNNKNYSPYYLISFCFLLILLYLLGQRKKTKPKKNEFN